MAARYAELVYDGLWYTPLRRALDAFVVATQEEMTGEVTLRLRRGALSVLGRVARRSLYDRRLGSFVMGGGFDPKDAEGFIRLFGLSTRGAGAGVAGSTLPGAAVAESDLPDAGPALPDAAPVSRQRRDARPREAGSREAESREAGR